MPRRSGAIRARRSAEVPARTHTSGLTGQQTCDRRAADRGARQSCVGDVISETAQGHVRREIALTRSASRAKSAPRLARYRGASRSGGHLRCAARLCAHHSSARDQSSRLEHADRRDGPSAGASGSPRSAQSDSRRSESGPGPCCALLRRLPSGGPAHHARGSCGRRLGAPPRAVSRGGAHLCPAAAAAASKGACWALTWRRVCGRSERKERPEGTDVSDRMQQTQRSVLSAYTGRVGVQLGRSEDGGGGVK
jgi:hypothetical protein